MRKIGKLRGIAETVLFLAGILEIGVSTYQVTNGLMPNWLHLAIVITFSFSVFFFRDVLYSHL